MGKHKSKEEWKYWFKKYESDTFVWSEYFKSTNVLNINQGKMAFKIKYRSYIKLGESIIISMSGKAKGEGQGRPKKHELDLDDFTREELEQVARRYYEITKKMPKNDKDKEASSFSISKAKMARLLSISRSGMYYQKQNISKMDNDVIDIITKTFNKYRGVFGRDRIAAITGLNYRRVGRYMKVLGLTCKTRKAKRKRESKNTQVKFKDLVNRDYNKIGVIATDVSYIRTNKGFSYLSIAINHFTKKIESWNFSKSNDNFLVMKHFMNMDLKGKIVHSDHGSQYSSHEFKELSKSKKFKISMSRVGNSLDNREAEYFFSNIKSESLNHLKTNLMSFEEVEFQIDKYIKWYNTERPQSALKWKTPEHFAQMSL